MPQACAHLGDDAVEAVGGVLCAQPHGDVALGVVAQVGTHLPVFLQLHTQWTRAARGQGLPCCPREPGLLHKQAGEEQGGADTDGVVVTFCLWFPQTWSRQQRGGTRGAHRE